MFQMATMRYQCLARNLTDAFLHGFEYSVKPNGLIKELFYLT